MRKIVILLMMFFVSSISFANTSSIIQVPSEVPNLGQVQKEIMYYHDSGQYDKDTQKTMELAQKQLADILAVKKNASQPLAIIFDIDETVLSNWPNIKENNFAYNKVSWDKWVESARAEPIIPAFKLYQYAVAHGVTVFFITGREESLREPTAKNLEKAGYTHYKKLYLKENSKENTSEFKSHARKDIESQGFDITLSVGDQYSDLCGGYADELVKVPNPFYFIPGCSAEEVCHWLPKDSNYGNNWDKLCPVLYQM